MNNEWHPCRYIDCTLEHDDSWVDGKWYEWEDIYGNREVARMKLDAMGMTDNQYKGMLLDQLEDWQEVLDLAIKAGNTEIQEKVEKQIRKINEKLKF